MTVLGAASPNPMKLSAGVSPEVQLFFLPRNILSPFARKLGNDRVTVLLSVDVSRPVRTESHVACNCKHPHSPSTGDTVTTPKQDAKPAADKPENKEPAKAPTMTVIGLMDNLYVITAEWMSGARQVSPRLLNQLDELGINVVDDKRQYKF